MRDKVSGDKEREINSSLPLSRSFCSLNIDNDNCVVEGVRYINLLKCGLETRGARRPKAIPEAMHSNGINFSLVVNEIINKLQQSVLSDPSEILNRPNTTIGILTSQLSPPIAIALS